MRKLSLITHGGHHDVCAALPGPSGKERCTIRNPSFDFANDLGSDIFSESLVTKRGSAGKSGTRVGVIFIDGSEGCVGLDAIGEIGERRGDEDEMALECAGLVD